MAHSRRRRRPAEPLPPLFASLKPRRPRDWLLLPFKVAFFVLASPLVLVGAGLYLVWRWLRYNVLDLLKFDLTGIARWEFLNTLGDFALAAFSVRFWARRSKRFWLWFIRSRRRRNLLRGAPALLAGGAICGIIVAESHRSPKILRLEYERRGFEAFRAGDLRSAELYLRRLDQLSPGLSNVKYLLAELAEQHMTSPEVAARMLTLAPVGEVGHGPAHLWLARREWNTRPHTPESLDRAELHLLAALETFPNEAEVHLLIGQLYLETGRAEFAARHLGRIYRVHPEWAMVQARLLATYGHPGEGRACAEFARDHFAAESQAHPDDLAARRQWVDAAIFLEDFATAEQALKDAIARGHESEFAPLLSRLYVDWGILAAGDAKLPRDVRLRLIEKGLEFDDYHPAVIANLAIVSQGRVLPPKIAELVEKRLARGGAPAGLYLIAGTSAWYAGDVITARRYLEQAHTLEPEHPDVANNLAYFLSQSRPQELERALALTEIARRYAPESPAYRDTRVRVLVQLGRSREALDEVRRGLAQDPTHVGLLAILPGLLAHFAPQPGGMGQQAP